MLVVTRKQDESIIVSDNIEITVLEIGKDKVKIGINAPKEVKIIRSELKDARQTNEQAAHVSGAGVAELLKVNKGQSPKS
jgi:carbon storage regulator